MDSRTAKKIKSKNSLIEQKLAKALWGNGFRYRKHVSSVCGKPDFAFISKKIAIFCDSEFWHGKDWGSRKHDHKTNKDFWIKKIERNIERDREVTKQLVSEGWLVLRFWGKEIEKNLEGCLLQIEQAIKQRDKL